MRGLVTDPSAAVIPGATVVATGNGVTRTAKSDGQGRYTLANLPVGKYAVRADAPGFVTFTAPSVDVATGQANAFDIALQIASETQQVQVTDQAANSLSVDASSNVGAIVLKEADLDALPDDPDDLQADLEALAGPAAGPNGAQFFWMVSAAASCRRRVRFAKSASTRIHSQRNSISPASAVSRF
jgi:hypothetical protein